MTTLVPQAVEFKPTADLAEILRALSEAQGSKPDANALQSASKRPSTVQVSQGAKVALSRLQGLLGAVQVPSERREVTPREQDDLMTLAVTAKEAVEAVNAAVDTVRDAIFDHFDVLIEKNGPTDDLKKDRDGHYLVKGELIVDSRRKRFTRELREERPKIEAKDLRKLWQDGEIARADYMGATKHVEVPREIDDEKLAALLKRKPQLLPKIAKILKPGKVTSAFYVRDLKQETQKKG